MSERATIPLWRWAFWWIELVVGMFIFYVVLTPIWVGIRALAWLAEFKARRNVAGEKPGDAQR
jgi:hypothetical protein